MSAAENPPAMRGPSGTTTATATPDALDESISFESSTSFRIEVGFESLAQKRKVFEWLGAGLRPDQPGRLQQEYPMLFKRNASVFHLTLFDHLSPVAFCTLWAVHFRVGVHRLRVGLISFVYTDPSVRGRGLASRIVEAALEKARALKLGLGLLWSDLDSLYSQLGFTQAGAESLLLIDQATLRRAIETATGSKASVPLAVGPPEIKDWKAIERMRGDRDCQLELGPGELLSMRSIPDMSVRVARGAEGVIGFAIRGRGDDFEEVIHEWGGTPESALLCCESLLEDCEPYSELFLLTPPDQSEVPWQLRKAGARVIQKDMAWMRVLSTSALAEDLSRIMPDSTRIRIREDSPTLEKVGADSAITITTTKGELSLDPSTFLSMIFGPGPKLRAHEPAKRLADLRDQMLATVLDDDALETLPLPFFVWGMESI